MTKDTCCYSVCVQYNTLPTLKEHKILSSSSGVWDSLICETSGTSCLCSTKKSCFGAFRSWFKSLPWSKQKEKTHHTQFLWFCQSRLIGRLHCCKPSSRQHLNQTEREERRRLDGSGGGWWLDELMDGCVWCVEWKCSRWTPLTAGARCQPAALQRGGEGTLPSLDENHVTETFTFVLKSGWKRCS